jgi:DNA (cytosine-5)-methyltransferase 1
MSTEATLQYLLIDLFCGAGGTTTGAELSGVCKVIAAINHDPIAIESHAANHSGVMHVTEDILIADIEPLKKCIAYWQKIYPHAKLIIWASLECTNFSNAKGGLARDADSRALANGMFRFLNQLNPDLFLVENVREFMSWGDLDDNGKPVAKLNGRDYIRWVKTVQSFGYQHDWRMLCAADFGGVTIRERYFGAFWKPSIRFAWPERTHAKKKSTGAMFSDALKPWRPVSEVLDFSDLGQSIFNRKRPLVDKTINRILSGLKKFHAQPTVMVCNSPGYCAPVTQPIGTITTVPSKAILTPIIQSYYSGGNNVTSTDAPSPTVVATQKSRPLSLATCIIGRKNWEINELDSAVMIELKKFMKDNGIADIYMRMLKVVELLRIQGFPDNYVLRGPLNEQKKFIGNSVETGVVRAWITAIANA